ncbi:MAG TPA: hypothetical protein VHB27_02685 [Rhodopila sp.]|uniref:F0F1 ATP synthase subunit B family protein n=1 Tax=Rhodopila sp. TaxID=2480087 RepID=UPI002C2BE6D7|nr:hypothetical protein [Rhodopila sp.]HVY14108.1 hypothetical protein [Rhodopila sp.]
MSFDWTTLALQTINLLVLVWLLWRFLFGPVSAMIAQRRMATEKMLADAEKARRTATAEALDAAQARAGLAAEGDRIRAEALNTARAEHDALIQQAQDEIARVRQASDADAKQEREALRRGLESDARHLAISIASRLLARLSEQEGNAKLLQTPQTWLAGLPEQDLHTWAEAGETRELITAVALDPSTQAACRQALRQRLGMDMDLQFRTDASLIAGVELRGPHIRLRNNWQADLDRMAEELSRDDQHLAVA